MISRQDQFVRAYRISFHPLDVLAPTSGNTDIDVEEIKRAPIVWSTISSMLLGLA